ncbi:hypothetical protein H0W26_05960 [Candidatus Dependentiae bacterium]|nr:hypothetical protein [Candidatus Dependentiae bacterium]
MVFRFKLHVFVSSQGEVIDFSLTPGNLADNNSDLLAKLMENIPEKVYEDKKSSVMRNILRDISHNTAFK